MTNHDDIGQFKQEFTQWMKEPEQYRYLMVDRLNKMFEYIAALEADQEKAQAALEKLSRLGNEPHLGNSDGNVIAQKALSSLITKQ